MRERITPSRVLGTFTYLGNIHDKLENFKFQLFDRDFENFEKRARKVPREPLPETECVNIGAFFKKLPEFN